MTIRVAELFAGVGGFRVGLERAGGYEVVWADQWEPDGRGAKQFAHRCYESHWPGDCLNEDVSVALDRMESLDAPVPSVELITAGFPCQDYSVAKPLNLSRGMEGPKGVLWWQICRAAAIMEPDHLMLENVDRLLTSPAGCRGRDFAVILASLSQMGYDAAWRVVRASDYGYPTKRRRFLMVASRTLGRDGILRVMSDAFPGEKTSDKRRVVVGTDVSAVSSEWTPGGSVRFLDAGYVSDGAAWTWTMEPVWDGKGTTLGDVLVPVSDVPDERWIDPSDLPRWEYLKGAKREPRTSRNGHEYVYSEGAVAFPDPLDRPARTLTTSEGGNAARQTHAVEQNGRIRRLIPEEAEAIMGFDPGWTDTGMTDRQRFFCMGNALVTGLVERMGRALSTAVGGEALS